MVGPQALLKVRAREQQEGRKNKGSCGEREMEVSVSLSNLGSNVGHPIPTRSTHWVSRKDRQGQLRDQQGRGNSKAGNGPIAPVNHWCGSPESSDRRWDKLLQVEVGASGEVRTGSD